MGFWIDLITHRLFITCVLTAIVVQILKIIVLSVKNKKFDLSLMGMPGGMPSNHTAVVIAMTTGAYYDQGVSTLAVAAGVVAAIVIYDTLTLRKAISRQNAALKNVVKKLKVKGGEGIKELLGHSLTEVIVGALVGYVTAYAVYHL